MEVPPAYSGFDESSSVRIAVNPAYDPAADSSLDVGDDLHPFLIQFVARGATYGNLPAGFEADLLPTQFLRPGDTVEVAGQRFILQNGTGSLNAFGAGTAAANLASGYFEFATGDLVTFAAKHAGFHPSEPLANFPDLSLSHDSSPSVDLADPYGNELPPPEVMASATPPPLVAPFWTAPAPYRVFRQPVPAAGEPYELPVGAAIDLQASVIVSADGTAQLYDPGFIAVEPRDDEYEDFVAAPDDFRVRTEPVMILFAPEGRIQRVYGVLGEADPVKPTGYVALCVGRPELIPARPYGVDLSAVTAADYGDPLEKNYTAFAGLGEDEQLEAANDYNWLNLESRWVVVGGQSGSISTIEGVSILFAAANLDQAETKNQIAAVLENASTRRTAGGR